jgi:hypothetical protein
MPIISIAGYVGGAACVNSGMGVSEVGTAEASADGWGLLMTSDAPLLSSGAGFEHAKHAAANPRKSKPWINLPRRKNALISTISLIQTYYGRFMFTEKYIPIARNTRSIQSPASGRINMQIPLHGRYTEM